MLHRIKLVWIEEDGVLAFEWTLLLTLLVIGIVSGVTAARDAIVDEFGDTAEVMMAVDQSYHVGFPLQVTTHAATTSSASDSDFTDALAYSDCDRTFIFLPPPIGQDFVDDEDS
jgi:hypothetical protein